MDILGHVGDDEEALMAAMLGPVGRAAPPPEAEGARRLPGGGARGDGEAAEGPARPCSGAPDGARCARACAAAARRVPRRLLDAAREGLGDAVARASGAPRSAQRDAAAGWEPADPSEEAARVRAVSRLASTFEALAGGALGKRWASHFEQWLFAARGACDRRAARAGGEASAARRDAVIPYLASCASSDAELGRKLAAAGMGKKEARRAGEALGRAAQAAARRVPEDAAARTKRTRVAVADVEGAAPPGKLRLSLGKTGVEVRADHHAKLEALHAIASAATGRAEPSAAERAADCFSLLARYSAACGAQLRGGGFHAALHGECFDALAADFGVTMECFASPLNCRWPRFCSQFPDVDRPFGSVGSFFDEEGGFAFAEGSFEANPPFDEGVVARMERRMRRLLRGAQEGGRELCFVVIIPHWPDKSAGWAALRNSEFLARHVRIPLRDHGYFEGAQHNKLKSQYRVASFDTSVFWLQSSKARERWPVTDAKVARLKEAFRPKQKEDPSGSGGALAEGGAEGGRPAKRARAAAAGAAPR